MGVNFAGSKGLTIKNKAFGLIVIVSIVFFTIMAMSYQSISSVKHDWDAYQEDVAQREHLILSMKSDFGYGGAIHNFKNYVLRGTQKHYDRVQLRLAKVNTKIEEYRKLHNINDEELAALNAIGSVAKKYRDATDVVKSMFAEGRTPKEVDSTVKISDSPAIKGFETLFKHVEELTAFETERLSNKTTSLLQTTITSLLIALAIVVFVIFSINRSILTGINKLQKSITSAEQNSDLTAHCEINSSDEIGQIAKAYNHMLEKFQGIIGQVNGSATQLSAAAEELSVITQETASEIQEQTSQTDQVATAINEMSATVQEVARNAGDAAVAANETTTEANKGRQMVNDAIDSINKLANEIEQAGSVINKLEEDGVKIGTVLDVIRGIAEQTNLLALNAAIEAARAGEQGRGFAVVADEVRTLASRTQESTQEIQQMIESLQSGTKAAVDAMDSSRAQAQAGVEKIATAGDALATIVSGIEHINDMSTQIASASEEQSAVSEEINQNVVKISQIADTSAANSAQTQNASEELSRLSMDLQGLVSQFKS